MVLLYSSSSEWGLLIQNSRYCKKIVSSWAHKKEGKLLLQGKQHLFLMAQEGGPHRQASARTLHQGKNFRFLKWHGASKKHYVLGTLSPRPRPQLLVWMLVSNKCKRATLFHFTKPCQPSSSGGKKFSSFSSSCQHAFLMSLSKARTIEPKPSYVKAMAIAIDTIFVCVFCWETWHEVFTTFPLTDGDSHLW